MLPFTNLPTQLGLEALGRFTFGNPDGAYDELVKDAMCLCKIRPIEEFLNDHKSILVGDKGTGKTAVFELLREGALHFRAPSQASQTIIIPINQQLDYRALKENVISNIVSGVKDESLQYRAVWELLILYFVIEKVKGSSNLPSELTTAITKFEEAFPINPKKRGLLQIILSGKRKIGIKLEASPITGLPTADLYAQIAADENIAATANSGPSLLRLGELKELLNRYLTASKIRIYVLVDRIDEFVIKEDYAVQRLTLQGLIGCERGYRAYQNLRLKLFLRQDLFYRIDFREFGADKVMYDSINLVWTSEDIRDFLSKRILHNYFRVFDLKQLGFILNEEILYVDGESNKSAKESKVSWLAKILSGCRRVGRKCKRIVNHGILRRKLDPWEGRHTNFSDEISTQIVQTFFPAEVWRADPYAPKKAISIVEFLSTHFNWSSDTTTPRIILMFAQSCVETIINFHIKNPDIGSTKAFPVLSRDLILQAYQDFKKTLWEVLAQESKKWRADIEAFRITFAGLPAVSFEQVMEGFPAKSPGELHELLAVLRHLGILACQNPEHPLETRYYKIPILFREKEPDISEEFFNIDTPLI